MTISRRLTVLPLACVALFGCYTPPEERVSNLYRGAEEGSLTRESLIQGLADDEPQVRAVAASIAFELEVEPALEIAAAAVEDPHEGVRAAAAVSLGKIDATPRTVPLLIRLAQDKTPLVRRRAVQTLGEIGDPRASDVLVSLLDGPDPDLRLEAAKALQRIGDPNTVDALLNALNDDNPFVRAWAARALGDVGGERVRADLERLATSQVRSDQAAARTALERLDEAGTRAQPVP